MGGLTSEYPALSEVPTLHHRAALELAFAAGVHRQHTDQDEHHAGFLLLGPTMAWKTSAGHFLCHAFGVDPAIHVVDLGTESGVDVAQRLAGLPQGGPPVVLISAESGSELVELVDASGALGFVSKTDLSGDALRTLLARADSGG